MKQKLLSLLALTFCWASSTWADYSGSGSGTKNDPYQITSAAQLVEFANWVNASADNAGACAVLKNNITLSSAWTTPIGNNTRQYTGTFDGGDFTISNFSFTTSRDTTGFFGRIGGGAVIKNFTIDGTISSSHGFVGVIGTSWGNATISNIHSKVNITCTKSRHAGILGYQGSTGTINIDRCSYSGELTVTNSATGNFGGIVGLTQNSANAKVNITNCLFNGKIDDGTGDNAGGIVGYTNGTTLTIKNCLSIGDITADKPGQFIGQLNGNNSKCDGKNYYITGSVVGNLKSGVTLKGTTPEQKTTEELASADICFQLNESTQGGSWRYNLSPADAYPTLDSSHKKLYQWYGVFYNEVPDLTISDETDLRTFAAIVNGGAYYVNAELTGDIPLTDWPAPIGNWVNSACYKGHFNGHGYTIGSDDFSYTTARNYHGIFGVLSEGAVVENFKVRGTITNSSYDSFGAIGYTRDNSVTIRNIHSYLIINNSGNDKKAGGIVGNANNGTTNIDRCTFSGSISTSTKCHCGGIVGYVNNDSRAIVNITNCLFDGEVTGTTGVNDGSGAGGVIGYVGGNPTKVVIKNCLSKGTVSGDASGQFYGLVKNAANSIVNCYYQGSAINGTVSDSATPATLEATPVTNEQLASGEVCYLLNGNQSDIAFYQTLPADPDGDTTPTLDATHGRVYKNATYLCPNTTSGGVTYSNTSSTIPDHDYSAVDGLCTYCCYPNAAFMTPVSGYYEISTPGQLKWFAAYVNIGNTSINAKLTATTPIDMLGVEWTPIGSDENSYAGEFDGQKRIITNFSYTSTGNGGLFGKISSATIKDFGISGSLDVASGTASGVIGWSSGSNISGIHSSLTITTSAGNAVGHVGGIVGSLNQNDNVSGCSFNGSITVNANSHNCFGGIAGYMTTNDYIRNCANYATITYSKNTCYAGGIEGYINSSSAYVQNCLSVGDITYDGTGDPTYGGAIIGYLKGGYKSTRFSDDYWLTGSAGQAFGGISNEANEVDTELASGEVAYKLGAAWYQTIGTDAYPTLSSASEQVRYVGTAGYTTFYDATNDWDLLGDAKAYIGTINGSALHLDEIDDIPAGTAVVIGGTYYNKVSTTAAATTTGNVLLGSDGTKTGDGVNIYALANGANGVGFYPVGDGVTIPAGKAYLNLEGVLVKAFLAFDFDDDATSINEELRMKNEEFNEGAIYNIAGQRMNKMQKGINIINGKKVMVK